MQKGTLKIESGSYRGFWNTYELNPSTGEKKRKQRSVLLGPKSMGKKEALEKLRKEIELSLGTADGEPLPARPNGSITLEQYTRSRWLPMKQADWRTTKDFKGREVCTARTSAEEILSYIFKAFGSTQLERLDSVALQTWLNDLATKRADSIVKHCRYTLKAILKLAVWEDYLRKNPAEYLALPTTKPVDKTVLTPEQLSAVITELDAKHSLLVRVCVFCAFRPSELLALRWKDFDPKEKVFHIRETIYRGVLRPFTKTTDANSQDQHLLVVPIPDPLVKELVQYRGPQYVDGDLKNIDTLRRIAQKNLWRGDDHFIFSTHKGTFLTKENVQSRIFEPVREKLELPKLNFQVLRRTMATHSQHKGSVKDIQGVLRHKSPDITATEYMQPITESMRRMVNGVYAELTKKPRKKPSASVKEATAGAGD